MAWNLKVLLCERQIGISMFIKKVYAFQKNKNEKYYVYISYLYHTSRNCKSYVDII